MGANVIVCGNGGAQDRSDRMRARRTLPMSNQLTEWRLVSGDRIGLLDARQILTQPGEQRADPEAAEVHTLDGRKPAASGMAAAPVVCSTRGPSLPARRGCAIGPSRGSTQLGFDLDADRTLDHVASLAKRVRSELPNVGFCLQSYLRRTAADVQRLLPLGPAIRLVKGAYEEPALVAYQARRDVDANYLALPAWSWRPVAATAQSVSSSELTTFA